MKKAPDMLSSNHFAEVWSFYDGILSALPHIRRKRAKATKKRSENAKLIGHTTEVSNIASHGLKVEFTESLQIAQKLGQTGGKVWTIDDKAYY